MMMLKVWILESFPSRTANHYAAYTAVLPVCVRWLCVLKQLTDCHD